MTFRSRLLIAFALATIVPLALLAFGVRRQLTTRLVEQHERRVQGLARVIEQDLTRESASIAGRLTSLARDLRTDDRFRLGTIRGEPAERGYVLDWGEQALRISALDMLQLQDDAGRIVSSGHFRNEFDRVEPELPRILAGTDRAVLVRARAPEGAFLALARAVPVDIASRRFTLVGGVRVDSQFLARFAREEGFVITLVTPDTVIPSGAARQGRGVEARPEERQQRRESQASRPGGQPLPRADRAATAPGSGRNTTGEVVAELPVSYLSLADSAHLTPARLVVRYASPELATLRRDVDRWFLAAMALVVIAALGLSAWASVRLSKPLAALALATSRIDLEGPELTVAAERDDEIGTLARRLGAMSSRLRVSAARLRQAERRATVGDMARQVNHDIKNGLIPIRNVLRHLVQVQEQNPEQLPAIFAERRQTLESSVGYLDTLARNYARLTPAVDHRAVDVNGIAAEIAASTAAAGHVRLHTRLADGLPRVQGDPVLVRRILDNLVRNAVESLEPRGGDVTIATARAPDGAVRLTVADTGRGMSEDELARAFDDFFTTKPDGTGLGLSVVRRLTADLHGSVRVESAPGRGTTFTIDLPACTPS